MNIYAIDKWDEDRDNKIIVHLNKTDQDNIITDHLKIYADEAYINKRANAYPPLEDQLDKIFHEGIDAWKADIQAVKDAIPKP